MRKWFKPKRHSGWSSEQSQETRLKKLVSSRPKNLTRKNRVLSAARAIQALANVTQSEDARKKAKSDARALYKRYQGMR